MKTLKVKANAKLRGELVLSSISATTVLTAESEPLSLSEKQFWADDIQRALATKQLILVEGKADGEQGLVMIQLLKKLNNLVLPSLPNPISFGYVYEIAKTTFEKEDIQNALRRRVIGEVTPEEYATLVKQDEAKAQAQAQASRTLPTASEYASEGQSDGDAFAARKLAELARKAQGPQVEVKAINDSSNVAAIKPESLEDIDMQNLSPAEKFALTGKAQTFEREMPKEKGYYVADPNKSLNSKVPSSFHVFDPRKSAAPQSVVPGKRLIKQATGGIAEDGVDCEVS